MNTHSKAYVNIHFFYQYILYIHIYVYAKFRPHDLLCIGTIVCEQINDLVKEERNLEKIKANQSNPKRKLFLIGRMLSGFPRTITMSPALIIGKVATKRISIFLPYRHYRHCLRIIISQSLLTIAASASLSSINQVFNASCQKNIVSWIHSIFRFISSYTKYFLSFFLYLKNTLLRFHLHT